MDRRDFLQIGVGALAAGSVGAAMVLPGTREKRSGELQEFTAPFPTYSVIPVVGDGKWIWTEPPEDATGYLEPRDYDVKIGVELEGTGSAGVLKASTAVPVEQPGQEIKRARVETQGCEAALRQLDSAAGQLILAAPGIAKGQVVAAAVHMTVTLYKEYFAYQQDQFPAEQKFAKDFRQKYMYDSPGIQTRMNEVRELAERLRYGLEHPWEITKAFYQWVWKNIEARQGSYTSVVAAIRDRVGDCEERACVFVALCRASGIPARQVWVPNHAWAEFYLEDHEGRGHWIPAHTSCYSWFGWTGAHELILQKGDSIEIPEKRQPQRLVADWMQWRGARPKVRYPAQIKPLPKEEGGDPGPGARSKDAKGQWVLLGGHELDRYMRV